MHLENFSQKQSSHFLNHSIMSLENQVFAPSLSLYLYHSQLLLLQDTDRDCLVSWSSLLSPPSLSLSPQWSSHLTVGPPGPSVRVQTSLSWALRDSRARLLGAGSGWRAPSRYRNAVTCNTRCHAPVNKDRENCPGQDFCEKFRDGRWEFVTWGCSATDYYRCNPDCWGHQIVLRSVSIGKWFNITISFLIANWATIFITLDNLSAFQQNVCDGMMMCDDIFLLRRLMKMLSISHFLQGMFTSLRDPK